MVIKLPEPVCGAAAGSVVRLQVGYQVLSGVRDIAAERGCALLLMLLDFASGAVL